MTIKQLESISKNVRKDILTMSEKAQSAHTGGALSCVEILVSLYFQSAKVYPKKPIDEKRDRIVFSKAHDVKVLYSVLAQKGFFKKSQLLTYEQDDSSLPGHSTRRSVPGIEVSTGSLGHGLSIACGIAYALRLKKNKARVYAILSDGECDEGSTWEAALFASHHNLSNLTVIIDYNKLQGYGFTKDILNLEPFEEKWKSFGFKTQQINGHKFSQILKALKKPSLNKPNIIIAHTIKGQGGLLKYINTVESQYKPPTNIEYEEWAKKI